MNWLQSSFNYKRDWGLRGLEAEALKYHTFEAFEKAYLGQIKHGKYWHVTDNPNFTIDPTKGPRDQSSMGLNNSPEAGKLMITSHLENWVDYYGNSRQYAALIDMTNVPENQYRQVNRGFGNEFMVFNPSQAKVVGVFPVKQALQIDNKLHNLLPGSTQKLREIWERVHTNKQKIN